MAQLVNNLPAMQKTQVQSVGREGPLEKGIATQSSILAWRILWTEVPWQGTVHGVARVRHDLATKSPPSPDTPNQVTVCSYFSELNFLNSKSLIKIGTQIVRVMC